MTKFQLLTLIKTFIIILGRSTSMSSNNSYSNRPEKCINQQTSHKHLQKSQSSSGNEPGPKERQQQMLKAELEAKKRELEELMKKDRVSNQYENFKCILSNENI